MASPCGINAALDEAKAGIDSLKEKIGKGLDGVGDIGAIADKIKGKLQEVNVPQVPSMNLREELINLPNLTPDEYSAKVAELKAKFGSEVPDLDAIIAKIPKPVGLNAQGNKDIFAQLNTALGNVGAAFQNLQQKISETSLESIVTNICDEKKIDPKTGKEVPAVPNVEVQAKTTTDANGNIIIITDTNGHPVYDKPKAKPTPPSTPKKDPTIESKPSSPPAAGFTFQFTKEKLIAAGGTAAGEWYEYLNNTLPKYNITTPERVAAFVGNVGVETSWKNIEETVAYKAEYLFNKLNPGHKRFATLEDAQAAVSKGAEYVANIIYMVERKLLDPQPGDGWRFRGRGLKQLTFKDNYMRASKAFFGDDRLVKNPDLVVTDKNIAVETGCWYFKTKNIAEYADKKLWAECGSLVNSGKPNADPKIIGGYEQRIKLSEKAYKVFST